MKLKGHTKIELKDVNTGEVKVYEDDNMFTNAISDMVNFAASHSMGFNPLDYYVSHWSTFLGGLVLLDTAQSNDAGDYYPHAGDRVIGYGGYNDTNAYTDVTPWGIYNTQESDVSQTDSKTMVWDFSTSHANGTIACVCLMPLFNKFFGCGYPTWYNTGVDYRYSAFAVAEGATITQTRKGKQSSVDGTGYGVTGSSLSTTDGSYVDFCIDTENDLKYMFKVCANGISIISHKMTPEVFDVFRSCAYYQSYTEETYSETFSGTYFYHFYNPDEQVLYFWMSNSTSINTQSTLDVYIHKFDMQTKTLTKNWKRIQQSAVSNSYFYAHFAITSTAAYFGIYVGSTYKMGKYTFSTGVLTQVAFSNLTSSSLYITPFVKNWKYIYNGYIYILGVITGVSSGYSTYYTAMYDTTTDTILFTNLASNLMGYYVGSSQYSAWVIPPINNEQNVFGTMLDANKTVSSNIMDMQGNTYTGQMLDSTHGANMFMPINFFATKNNLSEAITKTATQTMKVTYTITAEAEE